MLLYYCDSNEFDKLQYQNGMNSKGTLKLERNDKTYFDVITLGNSDTYSVYRCLGDDKGNNNLNRFYTCNKQIVPSLVFPYPYVFPTQDCEINNSIISEFSCKLDEFNMLTYTGFYSIEVIDISNTRVYFNVKYNRDAPKAIGELFIRKQMPSLLKSLVCNIPECKEYWESLLSRELEKQIKYEQDQFLRTLV